MTWERKADSSKRETRGKGLSVTQANSRGRSINGEWASKLLASLGGPGRKEGAWVRGKRGAEKRNEREGRGEGKEEMLSSLTG